MPERDTNAFGEGAMLWTLSVILIFLWALGLTSSYTNGGYIHILLGIALLALLLRIIQDRRMAL